MRGLVVRDWGQPPVLETLADPVPGSGDVLVRIEASAVSHFDATIASGEFGIKPSLPYVGGSEGYGRVVTGGGATMPEGTPVVVKGGGVGAGRPGTWAEYVSAPVDSIMAVPGTLSPKVAATFVQPCTTGFVAVRDVGRVTGDDHVLVAGAAGAVGSQAVQQALLQGAGVTAIVREDQASRVDPRARTVLDSDRAQLDELARSRSASVLIDTVGGPDLARRLACVGPGGRAVLLGYVAGPTLTLDLPNWLLLDVALLPINMVRRAHRVRELVPTIAGELSSGNLVLDVESYSPSNASLALERLATGSARGRVALDWAY